MNLINVPGKKCFLTVLVSLLIVAAVAQKPRRSVLYNLVMQKKEHAVVFHNLSIFTRNHHDFHLNKDNRAGAIGTGLTLNRFTIANILHARHEAITISVPSADGTIYTLELAEQKINVSGDFSFGTINQQHKRIKISSDQGLHYRGFVQGDSTSFATVSFFANGDMMGVFSNAMGNFNIGKDSSGNNYVVYNGNDMALSSTFECNTLDIPPSVTANFPPVSSSPPPIAADTPVPALLCKKVRVYLEGSYSLYWYNFHSNLINTQNYLTGLFNQVAAMYENEGIMVELASTYVWTTPDPYDSTRSDSALYQFQRRWNNLSDNFNGDIAQLVFGGANPVKGGIAYLLPDLCLRNYCYSYINVFGSYNNVPTYSWDVNVATHEMGHLFGSHHTHWCGWRTGAGNTCGAIDNCHSEESGNGCTNSCPALTDTATRPPGWQGTVMSYCHADPGIGINLANGFGPLPQAVIRNQVSSANCLTGTVEAWSGTTSTAWEDATNWSCGKVPDTNTDVSISQAAPNMPVVNSNAQCHSLTAPSGTSININDGQSLNVSGAGPVNSP